MRIIISLGNPGKEYEKTRHNVGFMVADELPCRMENAEWKMQKKFNAEVARGQLTCCEDVLLVKPHTFMNNSGEAVKKLVTSYKLQVTDILVIHDDVDLPLGVLRLSHGSGSAGQKGVQSIIDALATKNFWRLRVGIGPRKGVAKDFVLKPFGRAESAKLKKAIHRAVEAVEMVFERGPTQTQTEINAS